MITGLALIVVKGYGLLVEQFLLEVNETFN